MNDDLCVIGRGRDNRNKELFEKVFPELRTKRDQLRDEAYSRLIHLDTDINECYGRVGVRSFGVVRSEAELNQLAYELYEQEEVNSLYIIMCNWSIGKG
jgi:hypothetical protein